MPTLRTLVLLAALAAALPAAAKPVVVCTLADLGWIAQQIAGDDAEVESLCPGDQDPHFLPAKPSLARKVGRADLLVYNGLELEVGWLPVLVDKARNPRIKPGSPGDLDCSQVLARVLEVPTGPVSRAEGDVHALGNPHYTLDPRNGARIARLLGERLAALDPPAAPRYRERAEALAASIEARLAAWEAAAAPARAHPVVVYHKQWEYLADWLGLTILGAVEHRSGISPSPKHVDALVAQAQAAGVKELISAPWNHRDVARKAAEKMGATPLELPPAVGAQPAATGYLALFDEITRKLGEAAR